VSDTAELNSGLSVRVVGNNLLVRPDPLPTQSAGGIIYANDAVEHIFNTGVVLAVGYVTAQAPAGTHIPGIKPGDKIYFIRYLAKQDTNIQLSERLGDDVIRIRPADVLLVFDAEDLPKLRPDAH
jgi:co-chaperonin GroES (HSP10)